MNNIKGKLMKIFNDNGVVVISEDEIIDVDSLIYISIIVEIEEEFEIVVPDEYLITNQLTCLSEYIELVDNNINKTAR
mgnify:FL=1